jgi:hypothetical protein
LNQDRGRGVRRGPLPIALALIIIPALLLSQFNTAILPAIYEDAYAQVPVEIGQPFDLGVNQTAYLQSAQLVVKFVNVTEDSRCPSDVTCIWEGQVSVLVDLTNASDGKSLGNLTLTSRGAGGAGDNSSAKTVNGYLLRLVDVQPYPVSTQKISPSDYSAKFVLLKEDGQTISHGVFVKAAKVDSENNATTVTAVISGWNVEKGTGAAVIFTRENDAAGTSILKRVIVKFTPSNASSCSHGPNLSECIDGQITQVNPNDTSLFSKGGSIHLETDNTKTKLFFAYDAGDRVQEHALSIIGFKTWLKPIPAPGNSSTVALKEGQRDGPLLVQKIYPDRIEGLNFLEYPVAREEGNPITLHIGEKASNGCTIALTLVKIENGTAIFAKTIDENRPCPICWFQQALISG